jgi:hypothetical protein
VTEFPFFDFFEQDLTHFKSKGYENFSTHEELRALVAQKLLFDLIQPKKSYSQINDRDGIPENGIFSNVWIVSSVLLRTETS